MAPIMTAILDFTYTYSLETRLIFFLGGGGGGRKTVEPIGLIRQQ